MSALTAWSIILWCVGVGAGVFAAQGAIVETAMLCFASVVAFLSLQKYGDNK